MYHNYVQPDATSLEHMKGVPLKTFSPYVRVFNYDDDHKMVFDTVDKSIVKIDSSWIHDDRVIDEIIAGNDSIETLAGLGFFRTEQEGERLAETEIHDRGRLSISLELTLGCNLRCPYCYQGEDKHATKITQGTLDSLQKYVAQKVATGELREVVIKVLGGEPSLLWNHVDPTLRQVADICKDNVRFTLMIDTNAVIIEPFANLDYADRYLFTVPLSHRNCHDKMRFDSKGNGTYERVVDGAASLMTIPNATVILRHNTDAENAALFPAYLDDIRGRFPSLPLIDISYTASFDNTDFKNSLAYRDYLKWRIEIAIPELLKHGYPVLAAPVMNRNPCQRMGFGSMKIFSDDTAGYCALDFFSEERRPFVGMDFDAFEAERETLPDECAACPSFFICGGSYKLPCIKALGYEACEEDGAFNVDLEQFLRIYLDSGKPQLFPVFNQSLIVR